MKRYELDEAPIGLRKRAMALVPHAEKITFIEEYDPRETEDTYEQKRYRVGFVYKGTEFVTSMTQGKNKYY